MFEKHKDGKESVPPAPEPRAAQPSPGAGAAPAAGVDKSTMIGRGISISGDVSADSNLKIEGVVEGRSVQTAHDVEIGETAKVSANISAKVVRIAGEVNGDIVGSERVVIARSGRVQGNIVAPRVQLEDGALFRGSIDMNPAPAADARPSSARPTAVDPGAKTSQAASAAGQATEAATGGVRKEPGLTFKSG